MLISIIIPSYREASKLNLMLNAFSKQNISFNLFEIIVIVDSPEEIYQKQYKDLENEYKNIKSFNLTFVHNKINKGTCYNRNLGINLSKGKYLILIDSDMILKEDFLKNYIKVIKKYPNSFIFCQLRHLKPETQFQKFIYNSKTYFSFKELKHMQKCQFFNATTGCCCLPKNIAVKNKFDEQINSTTSYGYDDLLYFYNLKKQNIQFIYNKKSIVIHNEKYELTQAYPKKYKAAINSINICKNNPELKSILHYNENFKYLPFSYLPSKNILIFIDNICSIIAKVTGFYNIYRYVLGFAFVSGAKKGFSIYK